MSIHLVGGGWSQASARAVYSRFLREAEGRAAGAARLVPRIGIAMINDDAVQAAEFADQYSAVLRGVATCEPIVTTMMHDSQFSSAILSDIDALLIGGGHTPGYLDAVLPITDEIRLLVSDGLPYLGFSAGAAIASDAAIIGGWKIGGVAVGHEDTGEDLDEVTVVQGIGLVDLAIDVHAAQWGTLTRLIAATEAGLVEGGVAIDEDTVLIVGEGELRVDGAGSVWRVTKSDDGVVVSSLGPEG